MTFDPVGLELGRAAAATLRVAGFFGIAFPGFFAALLGFFEGI
jgi:hypothetical protein